MTITNTDLVELLLAERRLDRELGDAHFAWDAAPRHLKSATNQRVIEADKAWRAAKEALLAATNARLDGVA